MNNKMEDMEDNKWKEKVEEDKNYRRKKCKMRKTVNDRRKVTWHEMNKMLIVYCR